MDEVSPENYQPQSENTGIVPLLPVSPPPAHADDEQATVQREIVVVPQQQELSPLVKSPNLSRPILIIPGSGVPIHHSFFKQFQRSRKSHLVLASAAMLVIMALLMTMTPLNQALAGGISSFQSNKGSSIYEPPTSITYTVKAGDTFDSIAKYFGISTGNIYEYNHFYAGTELHIGEILKISADPSYGQNYIPPDPPQYQAPAYTGASTIHGGCLFCAMGGWTNGPGQTCAPEGLQSPVDVARFNFMQPEHGQQWVRGFSSYHNGIDMTTGNNADPIYAVQSGVVIYASWDPYGGGYSVKVNHCGGVASSYSHMSRILVQVGQQVQQGQVVGLQGMTGNATGPHVHFMIWWNNNPIDPLCAFGTLAGYSSAYHYGGCPAPQYPPNT